MFCQRPKMSDTDELKGLARMAVDFLDTIGHGTDTSEEVLQAEATYIKTRIQIKLNEIATNGQI